MPGIDWDMKLLASLPSIKPSKESFEGLSLDSPTVIAPSLGDYGSFSHCDAVTLTVPIILG